MFWPSYSTIILTASPKIDIEVIELRRFESAHAKCWAYRDIISTLFRDNNIPFSLCLS